MVLVVRGRDWQLTGHFHPATFTVMLLLSHKRNMGSILGAERAGLEELGLRSLHTGLRARRISCRTRWVERDCTPMPVRLR